MSELKAFAGKQVRKWSGLCEESSELVSVEFDGVGIVLVPSFKVIRDRSPHILLH